MILKALIVCDPCSLAQIHIGFGLNSVYRLGERARSVHAKLRTVNGLVRGFSVAVLRNSLRRLEGGWAGLERTNWRRESAEELEE